MNKFEKLIEYIINDEDQKARELFHSIVVEKSRDIYESICQDEMQETVHGDMTEINDQIADEEAMGEDEFSLDGGNDEEGITGDFPAEPGNEPGMDGLDGGEHGEHEELEDKVMSIDAKVDELLAKFDDIIGGGNDFEEPAAPTGDKGEEVPTGDESGSGEEAPIAEGEQPEWLKKGSGKSGSAASGKAGSAQSGKSGASGKSGSGKMESRKSTAELMREYVDRIGDIYGGQGDANEGDAVGAAGKKTSVNTKPGAVGPGADFGGDVVKTDTKEQNQDGTSPTKASNEYNKGQGVIKSGNVNVPGGKAGAPKSTGDSYEKGGDNQGDARGAMAGTGAKSEKQGEKNIKSPLVQNSGRK